ncbi:TetR/AcrR family transcriptional regulator [Nocardia altamirensis]|uniref:TetR/AcrR family transcriptional regulator n=1 Tax=Nocardia altamirensis TaxID=472158 RepID=UPI001FDF77FE|nr:TetR/AcrR family transcriptional regulator [Nocardia altamirensis]
MTTRRTRGDGSVRPRTGDARRRMVEGAIESLRSHGASATSVDRVLASTGAPRGSVYHHFPGGRTELISDAITAAGSFMSTFIEELTREHDPLTALDEFAAFWRRTLVDSDFRSGCPVFAVAVETNDDTPEFARAAVEIFARWHRALAEMLVRENVAQARANRLATLTVAAFEGAIALARAQHDITPLEDVVDELRVVLGSVAPA